jgi:hypothetical protein
LDRLINLSEQSRQRAAVHDEDVEAVPYFGEFATTGDDRSLSLEVVRDRILIDHGVCGSKLALASDEVRRRFLSEWFEAIRIFRDGRVEMVPKEAYRWVVAPATSATEPGVASVGCAGLEPATPAM